MKRTVNLNRIILLAGILVLVLVILYIVSVNDYGGVTIGMSFEEVYDLCKEKNYYFNFFYFYFLNDWGNVVAGRCGPSDGADTFVVVELYCYSSLWMSNSPKMFARIEYGMSPFEIVKMAGIPHGVESWALLSDFWVDSNGDRWSVYWRNQLPANSTELDLCANYLKKNYQEVWGWPSQ